MRRMNGQPGYLQDTKPDIAQIHNLMAQQQAAAMSHPGYYGYPSMSSGSSSPGLMNSPVSSMGSPGMYSSLESPLSSPLSTSSAGSIVKHICQICGDRASGKHYGVHSCEGCKGFFKRTVRKDLSYACRDEKSCVVDKRQRNRCQYCRYMKCLAQGMKRDAVLSSDPRFNNQADGAREEPDSSTLFDVSVERLLEAELAVEPTNVPQSGDGFLTTQSLSIDAGDQQMAVTNICQAADRQLQSLVEWAKRIPHFAGLPMDVQVILLRSGWNELLIASFSHRSVSIRDGILMVSGLQVHRDTAHQAGVGMIFDRVLTELVAKMREMNVDKTELACLKAIILFNPDAKGVGSVQEIERLRENVYGTLEEYCRGTYPEEPGRFAKLLLRLPALRSIGLKCLEHLFFFKLIGNTPIDTFLLEMLERPLAVLS